MRLSHSQRPLGAGILLLALLSACASGDSSSGGRARVDLRIEVRAGADTEPSVATLECTEDRSQGTGYLVDADRAGSACALVREAESRRFLIEGPPDDQICTEIYGGPQIADVTGTLDDERIQATFTRTNGCRIAEWERFERLLGPPPEAALDS